MHPSERAVLAILTTSSVDKFKELYRREYGIELTNEEAAEQAQRFLNVARIVMQPMPKRYEARYKEFVAEEGRTAEV